MPDQWLQAPIGKLRELLAASTLVQSFLAAADATEALGGIYQHEAATRPIPLQGINAGGAGTASLVVAGDVTNLLALGRHLLIRESETLDGVYTLRAGSAFAGGATTVNVNETLPAVAVDQDLLQLQYLPRIIVGSQGGRTHRRQGNTGWQTQGGALWAQFERETPAAYWSRANDLDDPSGAGVEFGSLVEGIVDQLKTLEGRAGRLHVFQMEELTPASEEGEDLNYGRPYWWQAIGFETGVG